MKYFAKKSQSKMCAVLPWFSIMRASLLLFTVLSCLFLANSMAFAQQMDAPPVYIVVKGNYSARVQNLHAGRTFYRGSYTADSAAGSVLVQKSGPGNVIPSGLDITSSVGAASAHVNYAALLAYSNADFNSAYGSVQNIEVNGRVEVYMRGGPRTKFRLNYGFVESVAASVSTDKPYNNFGSTWMQARFTMAPMDRGVTAFATLGSPGTQSDRDSQDVEGVTTSQTITNPNFPGQVYSLAWASDQGGAAQVWYGASFPFTGQSRFKASIQVSAHLVRPNQQPPVAIISGPSHVRRNQSTQFSGANSYDPDGNIIEYRWTFETPEGGTETRWGPLVEYAWSKRGTYNVALTVTDNEGQTSTSSTTATVSSDPSITINRISIDGAELSANELPFCSADIIHCEATTTEADGLSIKWFVRTHPDSGMATPDTGSGNTYDFRLNVPQWSDLYNPRPRLRYTVHAVLIDSQGTEVAQDNKPVIQSELGQLRQEYPDHNLSRIPRVSEFVPIPRDHPWNRGGYSWALISPWVTTTIEQLNAEAVGVIPPEYLPLQVNSVYRNPVQHWRVYRDEHPGRPVFVDSSHLYGFGIDFQVRPRNLPAYNRLRNLCRRHGSVRWEKTVGHVHVEAAPTTQ